MRRDRHQDGGQGANTPEAERGEIRRMFDRAEDAREYGAGAYFAARGKAQKALAAWRTKYPELAVVEDAQGLLDQAADLRRKAQGALTYDADGWLDAATQQKRHDEWIAEAEKLEAAAALRGRA